MREAGIDLRLAQGQRLARRADRAASIAGRPIQTRSFRRRSERITLPSRPSIGLITLYIRFCNTTVSFRRTWRRTRATASAVPRASARILALACPPRPLPGPPCPPAGRTGRAYFDSATSSRAGLPGEAVHTLTHLFERVRYGARRSSNDEISQAIACLTAIRNYCGETQ